MILPLFDNIVKEAQNTCITKAIALKDVGMDGDIALCTIKEIFEQCFYKTFAYLEKERKNEENKFEYTSTYSSDLIYSNTFRVLKDENIEDIIDYYPIFKLGVFTGLNNAKREYRETEKYDNQIDAIKEVLNKTFLVTYAHINIFKKLQ